MEHSAPLLESHASDNGAECFLGEPMAKKINIYYDSPFRDIYRSGLMPKKYWFYSKASSQDGDRGFMRVLGIVIEWKPLEDEETE